MFMLCLVLLEIWLIWLNDRIFSISFHFHHLVASSSRVTRRLCDTDISRHSTQMIRLVLGPY